jgi:hypothetical protein
MTLLPHPGKARITEYNFVQVILPERLTAGAWWRDFSPQPISSLIDTARISSL